VEGNYVTCHVAPLYVAIWATGAPSHPVRPATAPLEKSLGKWEESFFRRSSRFANGSRNFSGGKVVRLMGAAISPAEKLFCKWEQPFFRRRNQFANGSRHFSDGKVTWQMGAVIFPTEKSFYKWEQSLFRRRNRFANGSSRFSGGKVTWQICKMTGLMSKTLKNTLK
jgi:hypothetical protein